MLKKIIFFLLLVFIFPALCFGWQARVTEIISGDTIKVLHNEGLKTITLYGIECPGGQQPYSKEAAEFITGFILGQTIEVDPILSNRQGGITGIVYFKDQCLNEELIKAGLAWVSLKTARITKIRVVWRGLESEAKKTGMGLWSDPDPIPPWKF